MQFETYETVPYTEELLGLPALFESAMNIDVSAFADWLERHRSGALLAIGAGGSLAIAQFAAHLHHRSTGAVGKAGTPMEFFQRRVPQIGSSGMLVTASGRHSDSLAIAKRLMTETDNWAVFCGTIGSRSEELLATSAAAVFAYDLLPANVSWVSVSGLFGQAVVLARAYSHVFPAEVGGVPESFADLLPSGAPDIAGAIEAMVGEIKAVAERSKLAVLYGPDTAAAAIDLDSKFAEAGMGSLQTSEYRNFAHGRYHSMIADWTEFGLLGLYSYTEAAIAGATLALIPDSMPHVGLEVPGTGAAEIGVAALLSELILVEAIGRVRGLRPGWGSRNTFGDLLYELNLEQYFPDPVATHFTGTGQ